MSEGRQYFCCERYELYDNGILIDRMPGTREGDVISPVYIGGMQQLCYEAEDGTSLVVVEENFVRIHLNDDGTRTQDQSIPSDWVKLDLEGAIAHFTEKMGRAPSEREVY